MGCSNAFTLTYVSPTGLNKKHILETHTHTHQKQCVTARKPLFDVTMEVKVKFLYDGQQKNLYKELSCQAKCPLHCSLLSRAQAIKKLKGRKNKH